MRGGGSERGGGVRARDRMRKRYQLETERNDQSQIQHIV